MSKAPFAKKVLLTSLLIPVVTCSAAFAQTSGAEPTLPANSVDLAEPLPDYFYVPIWGLRVGGTDVLRKPANKSQKYYSVGQAILKVSPSYIDYGTQVIGHPLMQDVVVLQNVGAAPLSIGTVAPPHQYLSGKECDGATLPPMGTCIFTITYSPVDVRSAEGEATIPFTAKGGSAAGVVVLKGVSVKPADGGGGTSLELGEVTDGVYSLSFPPPIYLGDSPKYRKFVLESSGTKNLSIKNISVTDGSMFYAHSHDCPSILPSGSSCEIRVQLKPLVAGSVSGELRIESTSQDDSNIRVKLSAYIDEWVRKLTNPETLDFEIVDQGFTTTRSIDLKATGNLPVSGIKVTPPAPFTVSANTCTTTLQPEQSCRVTFSLNSNTRGPVSGIATITATDLSIPATNVQLKADVQLRQGTFSPTSFAFGLKDMAKLATPRSLTFTNTGSIPVVPYFGPTAVPHPTSAAAGTSFEQWFNTWTFIDRADCVNPVAPGSSCTALVTVQPNLTSALSGSTVVYPNSGMSVRGTTLSFSTTGTKQSFVYTPTLIDLGVLNGVHTMSASIAIANTSLDATTLTGFGTALTQPSAGRGTIALSGGTCGDTLTAAAKTCVIQAQITGSSLARDSLQESKDGAIHFRYSGADGTYTTVPVNFVLQGNEPVVTIDEAQGGLNFGDVPVGVAAANAPRRFIRVENPGPSAFAVSGITYPGAKAYSLTTAIDSTVAGSCKFNQSIPAGTSCVLALYPSSAANSTWGDVSTRVQLTTVVNGVAQPFGPEFTMTAKHLPVTLALPDEVTLEGGEQRENIFNVPFTVSHGGSAILQPSAAFGTLISAGVANTCAGIAVFGDAACSVTVTASAAKGSGQRKLNVPISINYEGKLVQIDEIAVKFNPEPGTFTLTPDAWNLGDVTAQGVVSEVPALRGVSVLENTSTRANLIVKSTVDNSSMYRPYSIPGSFDIQGAKVNCINVTLAPGQKCAWALDMATAAGNVTASGEYAGTAKLTLENEAAHAPLPITANFLRGELEVVSAQTTFSDIPSASVSGANKIVLRNKGQGNTRFVANVGRSGIFSAVSSGSTVDFKLRSATGALATELNPTNSLHKAAGTSSDENCSLYYGLQPGAECSLYVYMTPTGSARDYTGELRISARNPEEQPLVVPLSGNSLTGSVYYSSQTFNFPKDMLVGTTYTSQITVGNGGNYPLSISTLLLNSDYSPTTPSYPESEISMQHNCPSSLPAGQECIIEMTLTPDRNMDWGVTAPKQRVNLVENTNGVATQKYLYMAGTSTESFLTATPYTHNLDGVIERANFPSQFIYEVNYRASGNAPVRITSTRTGEGMFSYKNSTCTVGKTLQPGDSCKVEIWSADNYYSQVNENVNAPQTFVLYPFNINGTQVDDTAKTIFDRGVVNRLIAYVLPPSSTFSVTPSVLPANKSLPVHVYHPSLVAGVQAEIDNIGSLPNPVSLPDSKLVANSKSPGFSLNYSASGLPRPVVIGLKNKGVAPLFKKTITANADNVYDARDGKKVYSVTQGQVPVSYGFAYPVSATDSLSVNAIRAPGSSGFHSMATAGFDSLINASSAQINVSGVEYTGTVLEDGSALSAIGSDYHTASSCNRLGCSLNYSNATYKLLKTSPGGEGDLSVSTVFASSGVNIAPYRMNVIRLNVVDENNYVGLYSSTSVSYIEGKSGGITFGAGSRLGVYVNSESVTGLIAYDGYLYVAQGDAIYTYNLSNLGAYPAIYRFTDVLKESGTHSMVFNKKASSIVTSCHAGTAICSIPAVKGSLGVAVVEAGIPGSRGNNDGDDDATLDIHSLLNVSPDGQTVYFTSKSGANRVRGAVISGIPTFGSVAAIDNDFLAELDQNKAMVPHTITLINKGTQPLNVVRLSQSEVEYSTSCSDTPYLSECEVTVQFPKSMTDMGAGTFNIETSSLVDVPVTWRVAGDIGLFETYRAWRDGSYAASCKSYREGAGTFAYSGAIGNGVYRIQPSGMPATDVYCDMMTDGGGWTLLARSVATQFPSNIFNTTLNANAIHTPNATGASALNLSQWSVAMNTQQAMLISPHHSASPIIDRATGNWTYSSTRCGALLGHTSTTAGCANEIANDNYSTDDAFNIAIDRGTKGIAPSYRIDACYKGGGFCNFGFYLR